MNKKIEIIGFLKSLKISILDNKIRIVKKTIFKYIEYDIPLENLEHNKTVKTEINRDLIFLSLISFLVGIVFNMADGDIIFAVFSVISVILLLTGLSTKKRTISIDSLSKPTIALSFKKGNEKKIRDFADLLIQESKNYVIKKYSKVDKDLPVENQLLNIEYLRNNDLIDDSKFEQLKNIILNKKANDKTIGFD